MQFCKGGMVCKKLSVHANFPPLLNRSSQGSKAFEESSSHDRQGKSNTNRKVFFDENYVERRKLQKFIITILELPTPEVQLVKKRKSSHNML
jgi:hypothetical protein